MALVRASTPEQVTEALEHPATSLDVAQAAFDAVVPSHGAVHEPVSPRVEAAVMQQEAMFAETPRFVPLSPVHASVEAIPPTSPVVQNRSEDQVIRPVRLPQIEDFPVVAQSQMRAAQSPAPAAPPALEAKRMTLLQRLAAVGLGRRDDHEPDAVAAPAAAAPLPVAEPARRPAVQPPLRSAQGQLDSHGRTQARSIEDDQLEIPAFLRRQAH
jgi:cell division protein FtsZ